MSKHFNPTEIKADLEKYLNDKDLYPMLVDAIENILLNKPESPQDFLVRYFLERFPEETSKIRLQLSTSGPRRQSVSQVTNES